MTIYKDQLEAVYKLIEKPENWTQGAYARDANGDDVGHATSLSQHDALSPRARCWCLAGAAIKCGVIEADSKYGGSRDLMKALGITHLETHELNDSVTHEKLLELLRSAIERAPVREVP